MSEKKRSSNRRNRCRGNAILELAVTIPVVMLIFAGAADFARVFRDAITATDAAHAGAFWGSLNTSNSRRFTDIRDVATTSASDLDGPNVSAENFCDCPDAPAKGPSDPNAVPCSTGTCPGYGSPRSYVRCRVGAAFDSALPYPGIPSDLQVGRQVYMRVQ